MGLVDVASLSVEDWPREEDETWEFKSSQLSPPKLREELPRYVSAFANSGGGCLLWGVSDDTGDPDGGVERKVGNQPVADWLDKAISQQVQPPPTYHVREFTQADGRGDIDKGKAVLAIAVDPGPQAPFQYAKKGAYYFRAGRHTEPAPHSLVEAIWARRQVQSPVVKCISRSSRLDYCLDQIALVNLTNAPAYDVSVELQVSWCEGSEAGSFDTKHTCGIMSDSSPLYIYMPLHVETPQGRAWRRCNAGMRTEVKEPKVVATWAWHDQSGARYLDECDSPLESMRMDIPNIARSISSIGRNISDLQRGLKVSINKPQRSRFK